MREKSTKIRTFAQSQGDISAAKLRIKHGYYGTPTYKSWQAMKGRVTDTKRHNAASYVLKGITFCEDWKFFERFLDDMGERPEGASLDRIDNDKGYYKENCRWATAKEQRANRGKPGYSKGTGKVIVASMDAAIRELIQPSDDVGEGIKPCTIRPK